MVEKTAEYECQLVGELDETIHGIEQNVHEITRCTNFQTLSQLARVQKYCI